MSAIQNRYEFVMLFDVENGNPNGDPDAGNAPRVDAETGRGIVTDVCLKRKVREYVSLVKEEKDPYRILIQTDKALNTKFHEAYEALGFQKGKDASKVEQARAFMCAHYYDVRTFGAVMNTGEDPCGIVRGPVQINFAQSIDPVYRNELTITRQAVTKEDDKNNKNKDTEMGKKSVVAYGLYRAEGFVSASLAQKVTGFSEEDLELLFEALTNLFEHDRSAARGKMCMRKLYVFKHDSALGNAPAHLLFDKIRVAKKPDCAVARAFTDYTVTVDDAPVNGVTLIEKL